MDIALLKKALYRIAIFIALLLIIIVICSFTFHIILSFDMNYETYEMAFIRVLYYVLGYIYLPYSALNNNFLIVYLMVFYVIVIILLKNLFIALLFDTYRKECLLSDSVINENIIKENPENVKNSQVDDNSNDKIED